MYPVMLVILEPHIVALSEANDLFQPFIIYLHLAKQGRVHIQIAHKPFTSVCVCAY